MYQIECRWQEAPASRLAPRTTLGAALILSFLFAPNPRVYSQDGKFPLCPEAYLQRLQIAGADTLREEYDAEFVILREENEKKVYQALSLPQRRDYLALYWRLRDPDPFTPVNERLEEHLRRRARAFSSQQAGLFRAGERFGNHRPGNALADRRHIVATGGG
jgi:hypothetical protein